MPQTEFDNTNSSLQTKSSGKRMPDPSINNLFGKPISVINVGLESMAQSVSAQNVPVVNVDWRPPANDAPRLRRTKTGIDIETANSEVWRRIKSGRPVLVGMGRATAAVPG